MKSLIVLLRRWWVPLFIVFFIKLLIFLIGYLNFLIVTDQTVHDFNSYLELWNRWDGRNYTAIAEDGYPVSGEKAYLIAFFPLYPILISGANLLFQNVVFSSLYVSTISLVVAAVVIYELVKMHFPEEVATDSLWLMFLFPTAYFFHVGYSESVFLMVLALFFYFWFKKNNGLLFLIGVLVGMARSNWVVLFLSAALEIIRRRSFMDFALQAAITGPLVGFGVYLLLNFSLFGDPFHYMSVYRDVFHQSFHSPISGIRDIFGNVSNENQGLFVTALFDRYAFLFSAVLLIIASLRKRMPVIYLTYWGLSLLLFVCTTSYLRSLPRHIIVLFPQFIILALILRRFPNLRMAVYLLFFGLLMMFSPHFMRGSWTF